MGIGALGLGLALGLAPVTPAAAQQAPTTVTFVPIITGSKTLNWTVPDDVCEVTYRAAGAGGGSGIVGREGGAGGVATGTLALAPGTVIHLFIGWAGGDGAEAIAASDGRAHGGHGGSVGGWSGAYGDPQFGAGGGGGATDLRVGGIAPADRILVVGGGGGAGAAKSAPDASTGGDGGDGGLVGTDGSGGASDGGGKGATGSAGGLGGDLANDGSPGTDTDGGAGGDGSSTPTAPIYGGGGGGAGWYGGGGGAAGGGTGTQPGMEVNGGGGGGGSSWAAAGVDATFLAGEGSPADEDGVVAFTYTPGADCDTDVPLAGGAAPLAATGLAVAAAAAVGAGYRRRRADVGSVA